MGQNITYKILDAHLVSGTLEAGNEIGIRIDQTLTQDATGTMAFLQFEAMGLDHVKNELALSYIDHNTVQVGFENADDHRYLQSAAARFGAVFSKPGNGICHQLHVERFGIPGKTLLGSDLGLADPVAAEPPASGAMEEEMASNKPAAVDSAAARPPATTRAITQAGSAAISGLASTMMSRST